MNQASLTTAMELMDSMSEQGAFKDVEYDCLNTGRGMKMENHRAIVYKDTGVPIAVVSNRYKLVTNEEVFTAVAKSLVKSGIALDGATAQVEFGNEGARTLARFRFPEQKITVRTNDTSILEIIVRNSYDTHWDYMMRGGALRFFCWNGMVLGDWMAQYHQKHTQALDVSHSAEKIVQIIDTFKDSEGVWRAMDRSHVSGDFAYGAISRYLAFEPGIKGGLEDMRKQLRPNNASRLYNHWCSNEVVELGSTMFSVYNALTHDSTHRKAIGGATTRENRDASLGKLIASPFWKEAIAV